MRPKPLKPSPIKASKSEITSLLTGLPEKKVGHLIHLGWLSGSKQVYPSQEGPLLSASLHPEAWRRIARLGGAPTWEVSHKKRKSLRLLPLPLQRKGARWKALEAWGVEQGLLRIETWWWTPSSTDEDGETRFCWSKEPEKDLDPEATEPPVKRKVPVASPTLSEFWHQRGRRPANQEPWHALGTLAAAVLEASHRTLTPDDPALYDGLYWDELLAPEILSAPRAGIIPHRAIKTKELSPNQHSD
jgi:hypothetical protein